MASDIQLSEFEQQFGRSENHVRFPRFCNSVIMARGPVPTTPRLDDSPGPDGGIDGSWELPDGPTAKNAEPYARIGWNVFQFKARTPSPSALNSLKQSVRGAARELITRANRPGQLRQYTLFTNLRLGRPESSSTATGELAAKRDELKAAILEGLAPNEQVHVEIIDGANLQGVVNGDAAIRETYFGATQLESWDDAWGRLDSQKYGHRLLQMVGRSTVTAELQGHVTNASLRFIGITGASGMGKTRLVLEATKPHAGTTLFVRPGAKTAFLAQNLAAYATGARRCFVVEDLRLEEAKQLAEQAALHPSICIVATIPSEEHLPRLSLGPNPAAVPLRVVPLSSNDARELLKQADNRLDYDLAEWVIQEAGGNPQVLLSAAELAPDLRQKTGLLKKQVAQNFLRKAESLHGAHAVPALEALSLLSPFDLTRHRHLTAIQKTFGLSVTPANIRRHREPMEGSGFLEVSGLSREELTVSPPLVAAFLVEQLLASHPGAALSLFEALDVDGRQRFLDRLVSVDSDAGHGLWARIFGPKGLGAGVAALERHADFLRTLARVAPRQTVDFLFAHQRAVVALLTRQEKKIRLSPITLLTRSPVRASQWNQRIQHFRSAMNSVMRELVEHRESSPQAMTLLETITVGSSADRHGFEKLFNDCFVLWNYRFPVHPADRWKIVDRLIKSPRNREREIGFAALFTITDPPHSLHGQAVLRRPIGEAPQVLTYAEYFEPFYTALSIQLDLAARPGPMRATALSHLPAALAQLRRLPPARTMPFLRRVYAGYTNRRIKLAPGEMLQALLDTHERFEDSLTKFPDADWTQEVPKFNQELTQLTNKLESGPFVSRLQLWVAHGPHNWDEVPGTNRHRYEIELEKLAAEVVATPKRFTPTALEVLFGAQANHNGEFARYLGAADTGKKFWRKMSTLQRRRAGPWVFGSYCVGVAQHDPTFVEAQLDDAMATADANMLVVLKRLGPTESNRRRLLRLVRTKRVSPLELAQMFLSLRWLPDIPNSEVRYLLRYVAREQSREGNYALLQVLRFYLHSVPQLPIEVRLIAADMLARPCAFHADTDHDCDAVAEAIAKADIEAGIRLFRAVLRQRGKSTWRHESWNPLTASTSSLNFYQLLRRERPATFYPLVLDFWATYADRDQPEEKSILFDLNEHQSVLLDLVRQKPLCAATIVTHLRPGQPKFWEFVYATLDLLPLQPELREAANTLFDPDEIWSFLHQDHAGVTLADVRTQLARTDLSLVVRSFLRGTEARLVARAASWKQRQQARLGA